MVRVSCQKSEDRDARAPMRRAQIRAVASAPRSWLLRVLPLADATLLFVHDEAAQVQDMRHDDRFEVHLSLSDPRAFTLCGETLSPQRTHVLSAERAYHLQASAPTRWLVLHFEDGALRLRAEHEVPEAGQGIGWRVVRSASAPLQARIALLHRLFEAGGEASGDVRQQARDVAASQLLESLLRTLHESTGRARGRRPMDRKPIIERCLDLIDAQLARAISIDELCAAAGVSDRTLRTMFAEQFGVSPHRYLMNRRMHAIHEALCSAREGTTVTSVCSDYGVWDFGRFARQYRQLYGVLPSQDLRAPRRETELRLIDPVTITPARANFLRGVA